MPNNLDADDPVFTGIVEQQTDSDDVVYYTVGGVDIEEVLSPLEGRHIRLTIENIELELIDAEATAAGDAQPKAASE